MNFNQEKDGAVYPTPESLKAAVDAGLNAQVEAFVDNVKQEPLIAKLPKPGKIKKETVNNQLGYKELELSNGARVILKKTDFKDNEIRLNAFQRGGTSLYGEKDWANTELLPLATMMSGLGEFSNTELQKALAGKQASVGFSMDTYEDEFSGQSTVKDLETMFQLLYLNFTDMRKDEKSFNMIKGQVETMLKNRDLDPENVFEDSVNYILGNHDWRAKPFDISYMNQINLDRMMQIVKERTANAANYTFIFVGAFDEAVIRPYIEQYIASLPGKKGKQSNFVDVESHPVGQTVTHFTRKSETPKAVAQIYWYDAKTPYTLENQIKANILGQVLAKIYLQKIREDESAAYSAGARGWSTYEGNNFFTAVMAYCPMKPEKSDIAIKILNEEMVEACKTVDPVTLKEIKELFVKDLQTEFKENGYWVRNIHNYLFTGSDGHTGIIDIVNAQTPESIAAFARQLMAAGNKVEVVMLPEE
jgi:zinc protease